MKESIIQSGFVKYLIISSAIVIIYMFIYMFVLLPMPFIRDSSILNPEPIASFLLFLGFIFVVIFNVNIVLTVIYVIFRIVKKIKKSE